MMTDVVVVPSLVGLLVGCRLMQTGTVCIIVFVLSDLVGCIRGGVLSAEADTVERGHTT